MILNNISMPIGSSQDDLVLKCSKKANCKVHCFRILKKSIDARKKNDIHYVFSVAINEPEPILDLGIRPVSLPSRPIVVGFGPAGIFAALVLARSGACPIVIERGSDVDTRTKDVEAFKSSGILNPESNTQFGEGGAGTFSDGKLNTTTHDSRISFVLNEFYKHGAPINVTYDSKPHIGTDVLVHVVKSIREEIISLGGEVKFNTKLETLCIENGHITGVNTNKGFIKSSYVILAIGHSSRDTFEHLYSQNIPLQQKAFSMGARIEHLQSMINDTQYGCDGLPAADYKLAVHLPVGDAYSFCMCPGGYVFASSSELEGVVTNGMSYSSRNGTNANSALLVSVKPEDFPDKHVLSGMYWQRSIEQKAFNYAGKNYFAPAQLVGDFLSDKPSCGPISVNPTYNPGVFWGDIRNVLPEKITTVMSLAIPLLDKKLRGFASNDAILTAPETRSSSPVRILRNSELESDISGLFPCGEGSGYAGGITSSAVDGIRCAQALINRYAK